MASEASQEHFVFFITQYEQMAKLETLLVFADFSGGSPPPLNPPLVDMVYHYIIYKYWPLQVVR